MKHMPTIEKGQLMNVMVQHVYGIWAATRCTRHQYNLYSMYLVWVELTLDGVGDNDEFEG